MADFFKIPDTDLNLCPLGLGTSGAGLDWDGADTDYLFDAYLDMGGNLIDTARIYSDWVAPETGRSMRFSAVRKQATRLTTSPLPPTAGTP